MNDIVGNAYVRRLQNLRQKIEKFLPNLEVHRLSPNGSVVLPEPESHRPYSPGDNPGYIDWNLYARTDRFFVKSMIREQEGTLSILLDTSSSMVSPFPRKIESAREVAGAIAYLSLCAGNRVQLSPWSDALASNGRTFTGENSALAMLQQLSSHPETAEGVGTDLSRSLGQVLSTPDVENSWFLIISDFIDLTHYHNLIKALAMRSLKFGAVQILHPEEINPSTRGSFRLVDPETGQERNCVLGYRSLARLKRIFRSFREETQRVFTDNGGSFVTISCQDPFEEAVMSFLNANRVLMK